MPGAGFFAGLLESGAEGIAGRKKMLRDEQDKQDDLRLKRLQAEINSPYFNPDHLPAVMQEMDDLINNVGKAKPKSSSAKKPGIFSQVFSKIGEATAVGQGGEAEPAPPTPPGRFRTQAEMDQRALEIKQKEANIQSQSQIKLEQERQKRPVKRAAGIQGLQLPLGTQTPEGTAPDPNAHYDLYQVGDGYVAFPAKEPQKRLRTHFKREADGSFTAEEIDRDTGQVVSRQANASPPAALLPNIRRGFKYFQNESGEWVAIPETTVSGKALPGSGAAGATAGGLPTIPEQGAVVGQGRVIGKGRLPATAGGKPMTPAQYRVMMADVNRFAASVKQGTTYGYDTLPQELGYASLEEIPLEEIKKIVAPELYGVELEEIERGITPVKAAPAQGTTKGATKKTATKAQVAAFAKAKGISEAQVIKELKAAGYEVK